MLFFLLSSKFYSPTLLLCTWGSQMCENEWRQIQVTQRLFLLVFCCHTRTPQFGSLKIVSLATVLSQILKQGGSHLLRPLLTVSQHGGGYQAVRDSTGANSGALSSLFKATDAIIGGLSLMTSSDLNIFQHLVCNTLNTWIWGKQICF